MNDRTMIASRAALVAVAWSALLPLAMGGEVFVAPGGDDGAQGTRAEPVATLERARDLLRVDDGEGGTVWLSGGMYRLVETLVLDHRDAGIKFRSLDGEVPILSGAAELPGDWRQCDGKRGVWENVVPESFGEVRSIYRDGKGLPRARSRGFRQLASKPNSVPYRQRREIDGRYLYLPPDALAAVKDFRGAELRLIPRFPWLMNLLPVEEANRDSGLVKSSVPSIYPLVPPAFGRFPEGTVWIENIVEGMDEDGEWMFESESRRILLRSDEPPGGITAARLTELVRIEGEIDEWDYEDHPVKGVEFHGIVFSNANRYAWRTDKTGWGLQHDWEMYDQPSAMVRLRFAEDCRFENCRFVDSGSAGLRMDLHAMRNSVEHCEFRDLGGVGILLAGYGMGWKDVNRDNAVEDSRFVRIGQEWWGSPAIFAWQSGGNRIVHNEIRELPYSGIVVSGRTQMNVSGLKESSRTARWEEVINHLEGGDRSWRAREPLMHGRNNEVAWNDISDVMRILSDGNAVYVSGTGGGNRVHHNFIHDIDSANINASLRTDDDQYEVAFEDNVIARCTGEGIVLKGGNVVRHNLIYDLRPRTTDGVHALFQRGFLVLSGEPVTEAVFENNAFVSLAARQVPVMERNETWRKNGRSMPPVTLASATSRKNLWWCAADPDWGTEFIARQNKLGAETGSVSVRPHLVDPEGDNFRVREDAPPEVRAVLGAGWDVSAAGPRKR